MEEDSGAQEGDPSEALTTVKIVTIAPKGNVVLDVTFKNSKETLHATRKATQPRPGQRDPPPRPTLKSTIRIAFRVDVDILKSKSKYFETSLGDTKYKDAQIINRVLGEISERNQKPEHLEANDLPWVSIEDDDDATRAAGRENVFGDMLRILHAMETVTKPVTTLYLATLAVLADRFDCAPHVSKSALLKKFKWPPAHRVRTHTQGDDAAHRLSIPAEGLLRQKILVSLLLELPPVFSIATKELIMMGSHQWSADSETESESNIIRQAMWWDLPKNVERELQHRRERIMTTIASVQQYFLALYTSRTRQCKLGYDSSAACDSYQLGEMIKFLARNDLLFLTDFTPNSWQAIKDHAAMDITHILDILKQCPAYQIDKNHTNCGLRTRLMPIVDYIRTMTSSAVVALSLPAWEADREATSWISPEEGDGNGRWREDDKTEKRVFHFTRSLAADARFHFQHAMGADRMARNLFTAEEWNWMEE